MSLLPKTHKDFGSAAYWDHFFKKRGKKAFEWYGEYAELCGILHKYIKPADKLMVVGCGNSTLSADLYDVGHHNITNIDISDTVIKQMNEKHSQQRPDMKYLKMDMLNMEFGDGEFSVVLDKGTLDALLTEETEVVEKQVDRMFEEIGRILRLGGRYICVTLAQDHILRKLLTYFTYLGWMVRVCRVSEQEKDDSEFHMPVFVFILTKFKKMANMKPILEVCQFEDQVERLESAEEVMSSVKAMQYYGMVRQQLNKGEQIEEQISLDLHSNVAPTPRYTLHIVDSPQRSPNKFAIFIVPEGRETEWLFSTDEGRTQLAKSAKFERLVVVTLHPDHKYAGMDEVKAELSTKVMELAPQRLGKSQVPFLSLGDDINKRSVCYRGHSELSGDFIVEDIDVDGNIRRRLIFLSNRIIIQSEARMVKEIVRKKGKNKRTSSGKMKVDTSHLCDQHQVAIVGGLALMDISAPITEASICGVLVGLGGGGLASFMHKMLPKLQLDVVELDPAIVKVATEWFGLTLDERLQVHTQDGLVYLNQLAVSGPGSQDVIIVDVDNKDTSMGMSCPPAAFIQADFLQAIHTALKPSGLFMLNLCCRNPELRQSTISELQSVFQCVYARKLPEDINEIIYALPKFRASNLEWPESKTLPTTVSQVLTLLQKQVGGGAAMKDIVDLTNSLEGLTLQIKQ